MRTLMMRSMAWLLIAATALPTQAQTWPTQTVKIVELVPASSVQREHMLIKVRVDNATRSQILEATNLFRARVVDVATDALDAFNRRAFADQFCRRSCAGP